MTAHPLLSLYLWIAPHVLQAVLAVLLVYRRQVREFPAFFLYTVFEVLQFMVLFALYRIPVFSGNAYTVAWMVGGAVSVALRFAVVHEVFKNLFQNYPALASMGTVLFRWATAILVGVAVILVAYTSGSETERGFVAIGVVDRAVSIVQCGLLVLLVLLSRFLHFSWRSYAFGISLGLGLFASVELATSAIRAQLGLAVGREFFDLLTMAAYHGCVLLWIGGLLIPDRASEGVETVPAHNLEQWNQALQRFLQP